MSEAEHAQQPSILNALRSMHPQIVQVATMYSTEYPHEKTLPEVLDAVTVAVPLRTYMVMAAVATQVLHEQGAKVPA
ncbi:MAG: hypothetical protein ACYCZR_00310 [Burkholderiales bacterium]